MDWLNVQARRVPTWVVYLMGLVPLGFLVWGAIFGGLGPDPVKAIERAILESDLGLTPSNDGKLIRLPIPQLTEERRKELVKVVRHLAEEGRVAIRNVRRDVMHDLKELARDGDVGDDDERRAEDKLQKLTDDHVHRVDELLKRKEEEIMEV